MSENKLKFSLYFFREKILPYNETKTHKFKEDYNMNIDYEIRNIADEVANLRNEMKINNMLMLSKELHAMGQMSDEEYIKSLRSAYCLYK